MRRCFESAVAGRLGGYFNKLWELFISCVCEINGGGQGFCQSGGGPEGRRRHRNIEIRREVGLLRGVCG
jgi:hypothetical protein